MIYGGTGTSTVQKAVLTLIQSAMYAAALWLLLFGGLEWVSGLVGSDWARAVHGRRVLLAICFGVVYARLGLTVFVLIRRAIGWEETFSIPLAFALYYLGFSLFAGSTDGGLGVVELVGVVLFVAGSAINTVSEIVRDRWKRDPANSGELYTGGLFRFSMHINYFGDILWVAGLACITANPWSTIVPVILFCFFAFFNVPQLDRHLATKYGAAFDAYKKRTKKLIPFVY